MQINRTPPTLREIDGRWVVIITDDDGSQHAAQIGSWFAAQFVTRIIIPQLVLDSANDPNQPTLPGVS